MELACFKTLWGHPGTFEQACEQAVAARFDGIEGQAPADRESREQWQRALTSRELLFIAEICTAGSWVPKRSATVNEHLDSLEQQLGYAVALSPVLVNCLGGCDAWSDDENLAFFSQAMALADRHGVTMCFETHRGRSFFNPWNTLRICEQLTDLRLTADFSHWCVVCERLVDTERDVLDRLLPRVGHIHARIGYDQGPQVPDPRLPRYRAALESHRSWWREIWGHHYQQGLSRTSLTPEFGPDGYQQLDAATGQAVGDLWEVNCWVAQDQREQFDLWRKEWVKSTGVLQ